MLHNHTYVCIFSKSPSKHSYNWKNSKGLLKIKYIINLFVIAISNLAFYAGFYAGNKNFRNFSSGFDGYITVKSHLFEAEIKHCM